MEPKEKAKLLKFINEEKEQILDEYSPYYINAQRMEDFVEEEM